MNVSIVYRENVTDGVLDDLARQLPVIISDVLEVPGGNLAILKPDQVSLMFSRADSRDVGADIRIMMFARYNNVRVKTENTRTAAILERVKELIARQGADCSVNVRLYLMEIGASEHLSVA